MTMLPETLLRAARGHLGQFTLEMARDCGVSRHVLHKLRTTGQVLPVQPRVLRFASSPVTDEAELLAAVMAAGPLAVASHASAAWLHGLDRVTRTARPEVSVRGKRPQLRGARVHQTGVLDFEDRTRIRGVPCTSGARTVLDCATRQSWQGAVALVDDAICQRATSRRALHARATELANGRRNGGVIRSVTHPDAEGEFWSWLERSFAGLVHRAAFPGPRYNVPITDGRGRIGYADALFDASPLIVELEGLRFHTLPKDRQRDADRQNRYIAAGYAVLRFTWSDIVGRPDHVIATLGLVLSRR